MEEKKSCFPSKKERKKKLVELSYWHQHSLPKLERVLDLSIMGLLLRTDLLAKDRSAVTRVIEILWTSCKMQVNIH